MCGTRRSAPVLVPPYGEQKRIARLVVEQVTLLDHIEAEIDADLRRAKGLRMSILSAAFAGRLLADAGRAA